VRSLEVTKKADKQRLWDAGGALWEAFVAVGGRMSKRAALDVAAAAGYKPQAIASHIRWGWLAKKGGDYVFTDRAWRHLARDYRALREMTKKGG
jgi:hypothetical protein